MTKHVALLSRFRHTSVAATLCKLAKESIATPRLTINLRQPLFFLFLCVLCAYCASLRLSIPKHPAPKLLLCCGILEYKSLKICVIKNYYLPLTLVTQHGIMIVSFGDKTTQKIWEGEKVKGFATEIQEITRRKLRMLNNSIDIKDLMIPPSNRLEKLKGNLKDFYSIRVNDQWRLIFKWENGNAYNVELIDYH